MPLQHTQVIWERKGLSVRNNEVNDDFALIASTLPPSNKSEDDQQDDEDDETLRDTYLLVIQLIWVHAQSHLESMEQELDLLQNAPPSDSEQPSRIDEDPTWKLDVPSGLDSNGPLLDSSGRVC